MYVVTRGAFPAINVPETAPPAVVLLPPSQVGPRLLYSRKNGAKLGPVYPSWVGFSGKIKRTTSWQIIGQVRSVPKPALTASIKIQTIPMPAHLMTVTLKKAKASRQA